MRTIFTEPIKDFIYKHYKGIGSRELTGMINAEFGIELEVSQVKNFKMRSRLRSGTRRGNTGRRKFTDEHIAYIRELADQNLPRRDIWKKFNEHFGLSVEQKAFYALMSRYKIHNGLDGRFEKGKTPWNKGKHIQSVGRMKETQFKKGSIPPNIRPIGYESNRKGDIYIKVGKAEWKLKRRYMYEQYHGSIPEGYNIVFKNQQEDYSEDNLVAVPKGAMALVNKYLKLTDDPQINEMVLNQATLEYKISELEGKRGKRSRYSNG